MQQHLQHQPIMSSPAKCSMLITISQIPFLAVMHILTCLDNKSKIAYAEVCKPLRASVMRNPVMIQKAVKEYHEQCRQKYIRMELINKIECQETAVEEIKVEIAKSYYTALESQLKELKITNHKMQELIDSLKNKFDISYYQYKKEDRERLLKLRSAYRQLEENDCVSEFIKLEEEFYKSLKM
jgi:hypothetical protein